MGQTHLNMPRRVEENEWKERAGVGRKKKKIKKKRKQGSQMKFNVFTPHRQVSG